MLKILRLPRRASINSLIESFDPDQATWVVSDLRSKFEIQQKLLQTRGAYLDTNVLRASDLWKTLLKRLRPDIRIVSRDFVRSIVRSFLQKNRDLLPVGPSSEKSVMAAMDRFAGLVFHPEGPSTLDEWFEDNPASKEQWGLSYLVAADCLKMLASQKMLVAPWIAAVLQNENDFEEGWKQNLMVDLGAELTAPEAHLFQRLSTRVDVTLIEPAPSWRDEWQHLLRPYRDIEGYAKDIRTAADQNATPGRREVLRLSGQLAETKEAVARTRKWLDDGIALSEIAILAPDIEAYWPALKPLLDEEGIPADKAVTLKLNGLPSVNRWMAKLRPRRGEITAADLEVSYFSGEHPGRLRSEEFRQLFANLYGEEDMARHAHVEKFFREGPRFQEQMDRDAFLMAAASLWDARDEIDPLLSIGRELLQNAAPGMQLPSSEWIRYVEAVAANRESTFEGARGGVLVAKILSAHTTRITHRIFLGLSEESLKRAERSALPLKDVSRLAELGFHLDHPDQSLLEFEMRWLAGSGKSEDIYMVGLSSFEGAVQAPSSLWMRLFQEVHAGEDSGKVKAPEETRWDRLSHSAPATWARERQWDDAKMQGLWNRLQQDLGESSFDPVPGIVPAALSPSTVKKYLDCPFILAAGVLFRLQDLEEIDLDLARTHLGTLTHAVFQRICDENWTERAEVTDADLETLLEEARQANRITLGDERFWGPFKKRQMAVAREFLKVEIEWKKRFSAMRLLPSESEWKIWFDPSTGSFEHEETPGRIQIRGRIDRLETDGQGNYVVVDYKAGGKLFDQAAWLKNNDLQLLFYMWALEKGAMQGLKGKVIGAFYYVYRDFTRTKGLQMEGTEGRLFPAVSSRRKNITATEEDKILLFQKLEENIRDVIRRTGEGDWGPQPREKEICPTCQWSATCRAPHLN